MYMYNLKAISCVINSGLCRRADALQTWEFVTRNACTSIHVYRLVHDFQSCTVTVYVKVRDMDGITSVCGYREEALMVVHVHVYICSRMVWTRHSGVGLEVYIHTCTCQGDTCSTCMTGLLKGGLCTYAVHVHTCIYVAQYIIDYLIFQ